MEKIRYSGRYALYRGKEYFLNIDIECDFEKDKLLLESLDVSDEKMGFKKTYDKYMRHDKYVKQVKLQDLDSYYMYRRYVVYNGYYCYGLWEDPFHFFRDGKVVIYVPDGSAYIDDADEIASRDYCDIETGLQYRRATCCTSSANEFKLAGLTLDRSREWDMRAYSALVDFKDITIIQRREPVFWERKNMKADGWFWKDVKHVWRKRHIDETKEFKDPTRITYEEKTDPILDYHAVVKKEGETLEDLYRQKRVDIFAAYYHRIREQIGSSDLDKAMHALADKYLWD